MINGLPLLYWRWNLGKSGQSWDYENRIRLQEIVGLHNCAVADKGSIDKAGIRKSRATLGEIVGLHNCAVAYITPQLQRDRMITYDIT